MLQATHFFHSNLPRHQHRDDISHLLKHIDRERVAGIDAVLVVENISPAVTQALIDAWSIDPDFFKHHLFNPPENSIWTRIVWQWAEGNSLDAAHHEKWLQLRGIYQYTGLDVPVDELLQNNNSFYPRSVFKSGTWPINASTAITYMRVFPTLYLFLVDSPIKHSSPAQRSEDPRTTSEQPDLRFPYAGNHGGLLMPSPRIGEMCTPMELLTNAFHHKWQVQLIFCREGAFPSIPLLYMLNNSSWETNYRYLDTQIKDICLRQMRRPQSGMIDALHDLREELSKLRTSIETIQFYVEPNVIQYFTALRAGVADLNMRLSPIEANSLIKEKADKLHAFFMENIQMMLGIISIRDAQQSIRRADQGMFLTALASVYLPISLATGIFGMNLKELTQAGPSVWVFVVTWIAICLATGVVVAFAFRDSIKTFQRDRNRTNKDR